MYTVAPSEEERARVSAALKDRMSLLRARSNAALERSRPRAAEKERIAFHARQQELMRAGTRGRNQQLFAHGSNAEVGGYLDLDQYAIRGLEAHGHLYGYWMAQAALLNGGMTRAGLLRCIFSDPVRMDYCVKLGLAISWEFARAARARATADFLAHDAGDPRKLWRKRQATPLQRYDIHLIEMRLGIEAPTNLRRGTAHDWIAKMGGHPDFWIPPARPPEWKI
jgi:hypothetical protein